MRLSWDQIGERTYEVGVDQGVVYPAVGAAYPKGAAWNGLTAVNESPSGAEETELWADNQKYGGIISAEKFSATIEAYTYPEEFEKCDGTAAINGVKVHMQNRKSFGFTYRNLIGNDVDGTDFGYIIHLLYGCKATPSEKSRSTTNDSPDVGTFSWSVNTTPVSVKTVDPETKKPLKATSHLEIKSTDVSEAAMKAIEAILYGTDDTYTATTDLTPDPDKTYYTLSDGVYTEFTGSTFDPDVTYYEKEAGTEARLPLPDEVFEIIAAVG